MFVLFATRFSGLEWPKVDAQQIFVDRLADSFFPYGTSYQASLLVFQFMVCCHIFLKHEIVLFTTDIILWSFFPKQNVILVI